MTEKKVWFNGFETMITGELWNVDLWFFDKETISQAENYCDHIANNTSKAQKNIIVNIKSELISRGLYSFEQYEGETVGGAIVAIDNETQHNHLDLLYVKSDTQGKGIGKAIWFAIEKLYPDTKVWETCTPYFEKRNIHFYVNICGFHITEFFNEKHPMPDTPEDFIGEGNEGMFAFQKVM